MCRFVAYFGKKPVLMRTLIFDPTHSLIKQSKAAKEGFHGINADGFGVSWYDSSIDSTPAVFRSTQPAWNDGNLIHLINKIGSTCFLGHVRASTVGDVALNNCHPFAFKDFSFVHNGTIRQFQTIKRALVNVLSEEHYGSIMSSTDSEHLFYLIMHFYEAGESDLIKATKQAFAWVRDKQKHLDDSHFSRLNIAITDGKQMLVTRYGNTEKDLLSLHYAMIHEEGSEEVNAIVVASEPLTDMKKEWTSLDENQYLWIGEDFTWEVGELPV